MAAQAAAPPEASDVTAAMLRAVELAGRGLGATSPNPVVGCVVLDRTGRTVGEGWHQRAGGPHAEVHALAAAGAEAAGGTAVVTLEPCNHTGRTGPCAQALLAAGIARVVYAVADPGPEAGGGAATLAAAGVEITAGVCEEQAAEVNAAWLTSVRHGRPHVTWKYAATLDGRSAAADGTSRWITSPEARAEVHRLRAASDAVLVGSGTLRHDDPQLAARGVEDAVQPLRVVLDTEATLPPTARVLDGAAPTLVAVAEDAATGELEQTLARHPAGAASLLRLPRAPGAGLSLPALLAALHAREVRAVLLEGGPTLAGAFLAASLVDRVIGYLGPALLGAGPAALGDAGITTIDEALRLRITRTDLVGGDLRITAVPGPAGDGRAADPVVPAETAARTPDAAR